MTSRSGVSRRVLEEYRDDLLGIPVILRNAVIEVTDEDGEVSFEIPNSAQLDGRRGHSCARRWR